MSTISVHPLPSSDWSRLTDIADWQGYIPPVDSSIVIIAEQEGQIIATWCAIDIPHLEGFWIHPDHRKKSRLPIRLVHAMLNELTAHKVTGVLANVKHGDTEVADYMQRLGMVQLPIDTYSMKVER